MPESLKKALGIFPPVFFTVMWAFLNFLNTNRYEEFNVGRAAFHYISGGLMMAAVAVLVLFLCRRHLKFTAGLIFVFVIAFFLVAPIHDFLREFFRWRYIVLGIAVVAVLLSIAVSMAMTDEKFLKPFTVVALFLAVIPGVQLIGYYVFEVGQRGSPDTAINQELKNLPDAVRRPNIYFIILDGYARADQLKKTLGFDNSEFMSFFKQRDFLIASQSQSSYDSSYYSIGTTFASRHVMGPGIEPDIYKYRYSSDPISQLLKMGYRLATITTKRNQNCPSGFECVFGAEMIRNRLGNLELNLLKTTPLFHILNKLAVGVWGDSRYSIDDVHSGWSKLSAGGPLFFYSHIQMPHYPYTADKTCEPVKNVSMDLSVMGSNNIGAYVEFLQCVNSQVKRFVDAILKKDPGALITIQADHGFRTTYTSDTFSGWTPEMLDERFSILNVWRLPQACRKWFDPAISAINTFPLIFSCLTGQKQNFLPDRAFDALFGEENMRLIRKDGKWINFTYKGAS